MRRVWVGLLAAWLVTSSVPAAADDAAAAKQHFLRGTAHFNIGEFVEAANEYRESYKLSQDPVILYNIAQAYRQAGDFNKAIFFYKSYLRNQPNAENRREVQDKLRVLEAQVAKTQEATNLSPNLPLVPDGKRRSGDDSGLTSATVARADGVPQPGARSTGVRPATAEPLAPASSAASTAPAPAARVSTGESTAPALSAQTSVPVAAVRSDAAKESTPAYKRWWLWTAVGGVVVVGAAVGVGVALSSTPNLPSTELGTNKVF